jgi:hypothetical protein
VEHFESRFTDAFVHTVVSDAFTGCTVGVVFREPGG